MSVLHVVPDSALGGGSVVVARLAEALGAGDEAHRHRLLLPRNAEPALTALVRGLPHVLGAYDGRGGVAAMAGAIAATAEAGDLIHAHGPRAALAALLARGLGAAARGPLVYTVHGYHGLARPGRRAAQRQVEALLCRTATAVVWVSEADRAVAARHRLRPRGAARVILNGLAVAETPAGAPRDVDVLFVGRLVPQKDPEAFVRAVAALPGAPCVRMVGGGALAAEVDALIARLAPPDLRRLDALAQPEVLSLMARARVVALTSRWEGLPTVALEAALSRAAVVGFAIPPLAEALGEAAPALTTPPDPAALSARIAALLADEPARAALAERLHAGARARFGVARMAEAYAEVYAAARAGA